MTFSKIIQKSRIRKFPEKFKQNFNFFKFILLLKNSEDSGHFYRIIFKRRTSDFRNWREFEFLQLEVFISVSWTWLKTLIV